MTNLFKKAMICTDLHFGAKSNSDLHNNDCLEFLKWAAKTGKEAGAETCLFLGDYHNNRASMNLKTMSYAVRGLEVLSESFNDTYFVTGNHDQFFRDKRDVYSVDWARHIPNIHIINDFFKEGDVSIMPWLIHDEHKKIEKIKAKYCFGHFELPHFLMNASIAMPDHGTIQRTHFHNIEKVYSGHFHKRQAGDNITYIGNCFPHNYGDAGDDARGCMILDWDGTETYHSWPGQPTYRVFNLSYLLQNAETILKPDQHVRVNLDIDISYEESTFIKETFVETYKLREISLLPVKKAVEGGEILPGSIDFKSVDTIVLEELTNISQGNYDPKFLIEIYRSI
jgi:DNA repair exonuclease SbcCD nuclease subunit